MLYATRRLTTIACLLFGPQVQLPTSDIKSNTDIKASTSGSKITYGDYGKQQPWAVQELKVHFHHDKPFKRVMEVACDDCNS